MNDNILDQELGWEDEIENEGSPRRVLERASTRLPYWALSVPATQAAKGSAVQSGHPAPARGCAGRRERDERQPVSSQAL